MKNNSVAQKEILKIQKTFSVTITTRVTRIDKNCKENIKTISLKLQFIDSARFIVSSLSNLVDNLSEGIHKIKFKYGHDHEKCKAWN